MNFPGLDPTWHFAHESLRRAGAIRPWGLDETRAALAQGAPVLVVATTALGDSLLTTPLLSSLAATLGPDRVSLLVKEPYATLYAGDPRLGSVCTVAGKYRWSTLARDLRKTRPTVALLANITEPDLIPRLYHAGLHGFLRYRSRSTRYPKWIANRAMLRQPGDADYASGHAIANNLAMAEVLGLPTPCDQLSLPRFAAAPGRPRRRRLLLHPGASRIAKKWSVAAWAAVAGPLAREFGLTIALTGSAAEASLVQSLLAALPGLAVDDLAGRLSLPELAVAQAEAALFLSGDTGPYHLAVAVGCPTVTLFAPTDRGSSLEACGPYHADPLRHRALSTSRFGAPISEINPLDVLAEAWAVLTRVFSI